MTKFKGIHHLAMITDDMDKTIRYWRDLLGLEIIWADGDGRNRGYFFGISETSMIGFFEWPEAKNAEMKEHGTPTDQPKSFDHVAIGVERESDLEALQEKLTTAGYWVSKVNDHGFIRSIYTYDPNNIPVEFCVEIKGKDIRKNPLITDPNPPSLFNPEKG